MKRVHLFLLFGLLVSTQLRATKPPRREFQLKAQSPQFWKLIDRAAQLETMGTGFGFTEGPVWDPAGFVYVSDEEKNAIFRLYRGGRRESVIQLGDPDGNTYDRNRHLIVCASVLRAVIRLENGAKYTTLADRFEGKRFNSPNDVVLGPDDALYFTDPNMDLPKGDKQEIAFQGMYRLASDGAVRLLTRDMAQPNGLAFSPDGHHLYVDDSDRGAIRVYDFHDGDISGGREFGIEAGRKEDGVPDGMKVDRNGNLFVVGPLGIWVWDSAGHHLGTIVLPEQPANLAWGDPDYHTLYITATTSVYRLRTRVRGFVPYLPFANISKASQFSGSDHFAARPLLLATAPPALRDRLRPGVVWRQRTPVPQSGTLCVCELPR